MGDAAAPAAPQQFHQSKEGPSCTPTVDGDRLYVVGLGGDVSCVQAADGKVLWHRSMAADFGGVLPMWSFRESPLVDGDKVICTPGGENATIVALDKMTGKTIWQAKLPAVDPPPQPRRTPAVRPAAAPVPAGGGGPGRGFGRRGGGGGGPRPARRIRRRSRSTSRGSASTCSTPPKP